MRGNINKEKRNFIITISILVVIIIALVCAVFFFNHNLRGMHQDGSFKQGLGEQFNKNQTPENMGEESPQGIGNLQGEIPPQ